MSDASAKFEERLASLERKHRELAEGYVAQINPNGLITIEPKAQRSSILLRLLVTIVIGLMAFKVITLSIVGQVVYQGRIDALANGTAIEQAVAWIMQADPLSERLVMLLSGILG